MRRINCSLILEVFQALGHIGLVGELPAKIQDSNSLSSKKYTTAERAYSTLQGNKECCLLKEKYIITGVEY